MSISSHRPRNKRPPAWDGETVHGQPLLRGLLSNKYIRQTITVLCPICGRTHQHGWPKGSPADEPQHRLGHCAGMETAYYIIPVAGAAISSGAST